MLDKEKIRKYAKQIGADLCGFASMDRFASAPKEQDPRYIFPDAKTCIVLAFRIPRGYFRGIEEGTYFANYTAMGYAGINEVYGPIVLRELCCYIEDEGWEAVPVPNISFRNNAPAGVDLRKTSPKPKTLSVADDRPAPDILIDMRAAAFAAGLGEFGWSKVFLTPEFGPMQRFVALLTDFECEPDPIFEGKICDRCMSCARMCTGHAISTTESDHLCIAGHDIEYAKVDLNACGNAYRGGIPEYNPFDVNAEGLGSNWATSQAGFGLELYMRHNHALEGARGCMRECFIHLEKKGVLTHKFQNQFRKRKPWVIDRSGREDEATAAKPSDDKTLY
ncbi:MAG: epoxyqueuosine reductase [Clostridia bacterium]|nr:epoxyqueuosine reductase [Clostridia bacterium]